MQTGCGPARHGVFDHRYYDAPSGRMKVNHSRRVKVPSVWHLLSDAGYPDGFDTELVTYELPQWAGAMQGYLKAIGINARITVLQTAAVVQRTIAGQHPLELQRVSDGERPLPGIDVGRCGRVRKTLPHLARPHRQQRKSSLGSQPGQVVGTGVRR